MDAGELKERAIMGQVSEVIIQTLSPDTEFTLNRRYLIGTVRTACGIMLLRKYVTEQPREIPLVLFLRLFQFQMCGISLYLSRDPTHMGIPA